MAKKAKKVFGPIDKLPELKKPKLGIKKPKKGMKK